MTEWNGQCRRQYGNVSNQFNECIQTCQHIRQWCATKRHNSQPIGLFVFSGVFSSTTLPDTSDLVSSTFSLSINCSTSFSVSPFAFTWTSLFSVSAIIFTCFCSNFSQLYKQNKIKSMSACNIVVYPTNIVGDVKRGKNLNLIGNFSFSC